MSYDAIFKEWEDKAEKTQLLKRLWKKDPTLWTKDVHHHTEIRLRLGWLALPEAMKEKVQEITEFADEIKNAGFTSVLLLGMGGSSLAPEVFQNIFGNEAGRPKLWVLDSTDPGRVKDIEAKLDLEKTLVIVSSKSGGTVELVSLFKYFHAKIAALVGEKAGDHFVAITDPGTQLNFEAKERDFRRIFLAPPDVGGRFSALTYFGLVPAALIGVPVEQILQSADAMAKGDAALTLGIRMAILAEEGRDKLTLVTTPGFESFGDWVEQLVGESTGKEGVGVVPVVREKIAEASVYGSDRFFVTFLPAWEKTEEVQRALSSFEKAGHPALKISIQNKTDLGAEFFRWEMATAVACALLKVNAFDQPDVQSAKDRTKAILKKMQAGEALEERGDERSPEEFWENVEPGNYAAVLAFLPDRENLRQRLVAFTENIRRETKLATTLGFGPRYLHSTGQLHKGGANNGVFILISSETKEDLSIPEESYTFGQLERAQAMGDLEALESKARWVIHVRLPEPSEKALDAACAKIEKAMKSVGVK